MSLRISAFATLLAVGAVFGFFYAWVCSTMWGLDQIDPRAAITAMQGMNASVRNGVFAFGFFGTPIFAGLSMVLALASGRRDLALIFGAVAVLYLGGGLVLTMTQNVAMNAELARHTGVLDLEEAREIWAEFSPRWQLFNQIRTGVCAICLALVGWALMRLDTPRS